MGVDIHARKSKLRMSGESHANGNALKLGCIQARLIIAVKQVSHNFFDRPALWVRRHSAPGIVECDIVTGCWVVHSDVAQLSTERARAQVAASPPSQRQQCVCTALVTLRLSAHWATCAVQSTRCRPREASAHGIENIRAHAAARLGAVTQISAKWSASESISK